MDDKYFDKKIKQRLDEFEAPYDPEAWSTFQTKLQPLAAAKPPPRRRIRLAVAVLLLGTFSAMAWAIVKLSLENSALEQKVTVLQEPKSQLPAPRQQSSVKAQTSKSAETGNTEKIALQDGVKLNKHSKNFGRLPKTSVRAALPVEALTQRGVTASFDKPFSDPTPQDVPNDAITIITHAAAVQSSALAAFDLTSPNLVGLFEFLGKAADLRDTESDLFSDNTNESPWQLGLSNIIFDPDPQEGDGEMSFSGGLSALYTLSPGLHLTADVLLSTYRYDLDAEEHGRLVPGDISGFPGFNASNGSFRSLDAATTQLELALGLQYRYQLSNSLHAIAGMNFSIGFDVEQAYSFIYTDDANREVADYFDNTETAFFPGSFRLSGGLELDLGNRISYQLAAVYQMGRAPVGIETIGFKSAGIRSVLLIGI